MYWLLVIVSLSANYGRVVSDMGRYQSERICREVAEQIIKGEIAGYFTYKCIAVSALPDNRKTD